MALSNDETDFKDEKKNSETKVDFKLQGPKPKNYFFEINCKTYFETKQLTNSRRKKVLYYVVE